MLLRLTESAVDNYLSVKKLGRVSYYTVIVSNNILMISSEYEEMFMMNFCDICVLDNWLESSKYRHLNINHFAMRLPATICDIIFRVGELDIQSYLLSSGRGVLDISLTMLSSKISISTAEELANDDFLKSVLTHIQESIIIPYSDPSSLQILTEDNKSVAREFDNYIPFKKAKVMLSSLQVKQSVEGVVFNKKHCFVQTDGCIAYTDNTFNLTTVLSTKSISRLLSFLESSHSYTLSIFAGYNICRAGSSIFGWHRARSMSSSPVIEETPLATCTMSLASLSWVLTNIDVKDIEHFYLHFKDKSFDVISHIGTFSISFDSSSKLFVREDLNEEDVLKDFDSFEVNTSLLISLFKSVSNNNISIQLYKHYIKISIKGITYVFSRIA